MRIGRCLLALAALAASQITQARAAEQVDLLLALAMDVSRSMEHPKFLLQREGYAAAITNPQVLDAIKSGAHQKIAICFIDWSGAGEQKQVIDWSIIDGADCARRFGDLIYEAPRSFNDRTSIGGGIDLRGRPDRAGAVRGRAPRHRCVRRRHQQCGPRRAGAPATRRSPRASWSTASRS